MYQSSAAYDRRQRPGGPRLAARFRRYPPRRAAGQDARVGTLYWFAVLLAGCASAGCILLGSSSGAAGDQAGKSLRTALTIPKLNHVDMAEPVPSNPAPLAWHEAPPPQPLPAVEVIPVVAEAEPGSDPAVYLPPREPTPGDTPMMRTWKTLTAAAVLAALVPPVAPAQPPGNKAVPADNKELLKRVDDLRTTVNALTTKVDGLAKNSAGKDVLTDLKRLEKAVLAQLDKVSHELSVDISAIKNEQLSQKIELQRLGTKLKGFEDELQLLSDKLMQLRKQAVTEAPRPTLPTPPASSRADLDQILSRLGSIEKSLAGLSPKERVAFSPPLTTSARVVLSNQYPALALFTVNGQKYRLEPYQTLEIPNVPAGDVTYEAAFDGYGARPVRITTIRPNEVLTLTAR